MDSHYLAAWGVAFVFTQLVEVPIYIRLLDCSLARAFGASLLTHPALWFVVFPALEMEYYSKLVVSELAVWAVETVYFSVGFGVRRAWWVALLANAASLGLGLLSRRVLGAP